MISHQYRCIFVHIPRCGGTSIENLIWPRHSRKVADLWAGYDRNPYQSGGLQHLCASHIRQETGATFDAYWKFAFVRNPWDRAVSQYLYAIRDRADLRKLLTLPEDASLERYLAAIQEREHVQWKAQRPFVYDNDRQVVDSLGRFERFAEDARAALERLGITDALAHENRSQRGPYRDYYSAATRQMVAKIYAEDIDTFGYVF